MRTVIDPRGLDVMLWCDYTTARVSDVIPPYTLLAPERWRDWGHNARRAQSQVPNPDDFEDWRIWADRFNQVMYLVRT